MLGTTPMHVCYTWWYWQIHGPKWKMQRVSSILPTGGSAENPFYTLFTAFEGQNRKDLAKFNYCVKTVVIDKKKRWTWTLKWIIIFVLLTLPLAMFIGIYRIEKITYQITNIFLLYKYLFPWDQYLFLSQEAKCSILSLWILSLICNWLIFSEVEGMLEFFSLIGK